MGVHRISRHHILHEASAWSSRPDARILRQTPALIPKLDREVHTELHNECAPVPLLGSYALREVAQGFSTTNNTQRDIDQLLLLIEQTRRQPKARSIEKRLAMLTIHAIELQRPYLWQGRIT